MAKWENYHTYYPDQTHIYYSWIIGYCFSIWYKDCKKKKKATCEIFMYDMYLLEVIFLWL